MRFWVIAIFLSSVSPAFSQTAAQANIIGVVTDESGAVLPGVSVTATSPSLQVGTVSAVSDGNGEYRLSNLPLGTYEVSYALDGFQTVKRSGVRLTAGFTSQLDIPLKLGSLNEAITVSGASPVVDVASSTPTTSLTRETLELIPTSRNGVQALLAQVPALAPTLMSAATRPAPSRFSGRSATRSGRGRSSRASPSRRRPAPATTPAFTTIIRASRRLKSARSATTRRFRAAASISMRS